MISKLSIIKNKLFAAIAMAVCVSLTACAQKKAEGSAASHKVLVAYFSATGTTARAAETVARTTGGDLLAIEPTEAYTAADLDWNDDTSRSTREMKDASARPALKPTDKDLTAYDVVFVGYPIWWGEAPRVVNSFVEAHDLKGKRLVPFATSGGSGIGESVEALRKAYPGLTWTDGRLLNGADEADVRSWTESVLTAKQ